MITLRESLFLAKGTERSVYTHPDNSNLCVKVNHSEVSRQQQQQEEKYLKFLIKKGRLPCRPLPQYYGSLETNLGKGLVFEKISNYNKSNCEDIKSFIEKNRGNLEIHKQLKNALVHFKSDLLSNFIIVRDLTMRNILVQHIEEDKFVLTLIDGFGNSDFIPLANYSSWYAALKIERRWERFERKILLLMKPNQ